MRTSQGVLLLKANSILKVDLSISSIVLII